MEDPQLSWHDSGDVLQGIMVGHDGTHDLCDLKPSMPFTDPANPLLDLQLGADLSSFDTPNQPPFLNSWSSSTDPHPLYYLPCHSTRLAGNQDAWNPLQVTGVPDQSSLSHMQVPAATGDSDFHFSKYYCSDPSENGSQYMGSLHSTDSGYGTASCATQSVVTSSQGLDSTSSPLIAAKDHSSGELSTCFEQTSYGPTFASELVESPSQLFDGSVRCEHPSCSWVGKCPSDKRKHEARHRKLFKCDEPGCPRKEGFGTINDLARHKKCVHNQEPERGPKMMYMCYGKNCPRPNKKWPRLDNFKQHLGRMHGEEDADMLLKRSMDWHAQFTRSYKFDKSDPQDEPMFDMQPDLMSMHGNTDAEHITSDSMHHDGMDFLSSRAATPKPADNNTQPQIPLTHSETSQLQALGTLGLTPSFHSESRNPVPEQGAKKSPSSVTDAADNLINAMTKMMNSRGRRGSQYIDEGIDVEPENVQLSQLQRQMLQRVFSVALDRLSEGAPADEDAGSEKQGWFQCESCPKLTRLRCEMKKHQKRHERPYGCTFPHCSKSFGSKADWKRHESSQHLHIPSWFCTFHDVRTDTSCERLFHCQQTFTQHLNQQHQVPEPQVGVAVCTSRLDVGEQSHFWCGFCRQTVALRTLGPAALDERFNHIDIEHFKKGERRRDWSFPSVTMLEGELGFGLNAAPDSMDLIESRGVEGSAWKKPRLQPPQGSRRKRKLADV
ncbi:hypothetical protein NUU61_007061 [Penicillium alfredii]|uniref:C2H2-type domain-containing protein n=1 Tax=Penicillium alfredii TaxID=1506179 RepID=A0A9W9K4D4_9EURO|nr:uncharacterized protein NUU61_007061 [Penicillium alfredii]KAJ5092191.1 hypothetical protein NUU61_007061 [Penicillium alfredii]